MTSNGRNYDYVVSLSTLSAQLHIYATNCMAKRVHANTVVKIRNKRFSALAWHGLSNMK